MAELKSKIIDEEKQAKLEMWKYVLGFTPTAVLKCAVELRLADVIETHGGTMTHADLSASVGCSPQVLRRIMRYLASISAIVDQYPEAFDGIESLVDVGGGDGTAIGTVVRAFPWIRGVNFDLPHVVGAAPAREGVEHVAGDMFDAVPKADAAFLMGDWNDEECTHILRKCIEAGHRKSDDRGSSDPR